MRLGKLYLDLFNAGGWAFNAGASPTVGVGGHLTCGGKGYNARLYGLAADQVIHLILLQLTLFTKKTSPLGRFHERGSCRWH